VTRSIASQSVEELGGRGSVLARQRRDHVELDGLLSRVREATGEDQDEVLARVFRLVFPHAFAEEAVLWPAARAALPDGEGLTLRIEQEHQEINALATRLERTSAGDPARQELLAGVVPLLQQDVRDEEDLLLPRLQAALDGRRLRRLGRSWELVRRIAPTRPHPTVARRPPGNVLAALPLTVLDRSRDRLDGAARRRSGPVASRLRSLSGLLARVSGAVERLGPMQRGEHPATRADAARGGRP